MNNFKWFLAAVTGLLLCTAITGCSSTASGVTKGVLDWTFEDDPPEVVIRIKSSPDLNPDINGRPSPIVVRIYALQSDDVFNSAGFFALYGKENTILGNTLVAREELEISPGDSIELEKDMT